LHFALVPLLLFFEQGYLSFLEERLGGVRAAVNGLDILIGRLVVDVIVTDEFVKFVPLEILCICFLEVG
jgi:hypothetical protein